MRIPRGILPVSAIVLAAGSGRRFGGKKLLSSVSDKTILEHTCQAALLSHFEDVVVVTGEHHKELKETLGEMGVVTTFNQNHQSGMASSIKHGLSAALNSALQPLQGVVVLLADHPSVTSEHLTKIALKGLWDQSKLVATDYQDFLAPPVFISAAAFGLIKEISGDQGLGDMINSPEMSVDFLEANFSGQDVDTQEDLLIVTKLMRGA
jgi:molybdenum cofactor cytidylyltransferase